MGTFKGLQILLANYLSTKTSYLPARERGFCFVLGFVLRAGFAFAFPPLLVADLAAGFAEALFFLVAPLLRFS